MGLLGRLTFWLIIDLVEDLQLLSWVRLELLRGLDAKVRGLTSGILMPQRRHLWVVDGGIIHIVRHLILK